MVTIIYIIKSCIKWLRVETSMFLTALSKVCRSAVFTNRDYKRILPVTYDQSSPKCKLYCDNRIYNNLAV